MSTTEDHSLAKGTLFDAWVTDHNAGQRSYFLVTRRIDADTCAVIDLNAANRAAITEGHPCTPMTLRHADIIVMNILAPEGR